MGDNKSACSLTIVGALQILFVAFKLANILSWPWWQICLPIIICSGLACIGCLCGTACVVGVEYLDGKGKQTPSAQPVGPVVVAGPSSDME